MNRDDYQHLALHLRTLTEAEQRELTESLAEEADAERTPAEQARHRWLEDS